jgi:type VI secretion system protein ImpB
MGSSQKFIARNRAPRVQIEYDVEVYGAEKKVQLPFVMGVMSDLSGKPAEPLAPVADRKFLEIDVDNFDSRMKAMKPRVAFNVPNTLTGEGNISVDLTFENMDDFSPAAIAKKVGALSKLLEARQQLQNLVTYMDGKGGAEELVGRLMSDPSLLASLASSAKPADEGKA